MEFLDKVNKRLGCSEVSEHIAEHGKAIGVEVWGSSHAQLSVEPEEAIIVVREVLRQGDRQELLAEWVGSVAISEASLTASVRTGGSDLAWYMFDVEVVFGNFHLPTRLSTRQVALGQEVAEGVIIGEDTEFDSKDLGAEPPERINDVWHFTVVEQVALLNVGERAGVELNRGGGLPIRSLSEHSAQSRVRRISNEPNCLVRVGVKTAMYFWLAGSMGVQEYASVKSINPHYLPRAAGFRALSIDRMLYESCTWAAFNFPNQQELNLVVDVEVFTDGADKGLSGGCVPPGAGLAVGAGPQPSSHRQWPAWKQFGQLRPVWLEFTSRHLKQGLLVWSLAVALMTLEVAAGLPPSLVFLREREKASDGLEDGKHSSECSGVISKGGKLGLGHENDFRVSAGE
ncbi:hypothetical protein BDK51DRAFT_40982 [Blyttiomyces helicus]|uniref:Uncharacterized protein n=1 Tax=Blyttiomyces helicus TaxID=388810 RepID=A0A4P9WQR1_9FUNG|nr:hypothetical protein BDK51DRAFT_40982 [Blyttiomyces helicus]|eukprot:RKO94523.1 hypothetical protein BDK51DRAFT_40982 [Blyttiomyces helicus]